MVLAEDVRVGKNDSFIVPLHTQKVMPIRFKSFVEGAAVRADKTKGVSGIRLCKNSQVCV